MSAETNLWWVDQANRIEALEQLCTRLAQKLEYLSEVIDIHRDKIHDLESRNAE